MSMAGDRKLEQCRIIELTETAFSLLDCGKSRKAASYFERAAKRAREDGTACVVVPCYLNVGAYLVTQGKFQRGRSFLQSALKRMKYKSGSKLVDSTRKSDAKHLTSSPFHFSKVSGSITEESAIKMAADIHHYLGVAHQGMKDYQKAVNHYKESMKLYLKDNYSCVHAALSEIRSSYCYQQLGHVQKEIDCLKAAKELYHQMGDSFNEAGTCMELSWVYLRDGETDDAKQMLSAAKMHSRHVEKSVEGGRLR